MPIKDYADALRVLQEFEHPADPSDPKARKQRRIVEAATELFIRHGYKKTSIDDVADRAGIAKGTVYLYFKTKSDLLLQAIIAEKRRAIEEAWSAVFTPDATPRERLRLLLQTGFSMSPKLPLSARLTSGDRDFLVALEEMDPAVMRKSEEIQLEFMTDLVTAASGRRKPTEAIRDRVKVLRGLMLFTNLLVSDHARQGLPVDRYAALLADVLVDGVIPPEKEA